MNPSLKQPNQRTKQYQNHHIHQSYPQNQFLLGPSIPQINSDDLMKTIFNTEQLIKRTKQYVQNIPIKTHLYKPYCKKCQSNYPCHEKHTQMEQQYQSNYMNNQKTQKNMQNYRQISLYSSFILNKSPTPVEKLHQFQLNQQMENYSPSFRIKQPNKQVNLISSKPLSQIQEVSSQQNGQNKSKSFNLQTFRPFDHLAISPKHYQLENEKYATPKTGEHNKNLNIQKLSTNARSPLNKTFQAYSAYSSNPSSGRSGNQSSGKSGARRSNQKEEEVNYANMSKEQIIRYFKKKEKVHSHISSFSPRSERRQKSNKKSLEKTLRQFPQRTTPNKFYKQYEIQAQKVSKQSSSNQFADIEQVTSKYVTPLQRSPRTNNQNIKIVDQNQYQGQYEQYNKKSQSQSDFIRECCTPFSRLNLNKQIQIQLNRRQQIQNSIKEKSKPSKKLFLNEAVYPFQNIENQYKSPKHITNSYKSPSKEGLIYRSSNPLTPENIKRKVHEDLQKIDDRRQRIKQTNSQYISMRQNSPQLVQYQSLEIFNKEGKRSSFQQSNHHQLISPVTQKHGTSGRKKGIKVMLNTSIHSSPGVQINCKLPIYDSNSKQKDQKQKQYIQISIQNENQNQQLQKPSGNNHHQIKPINIQTDKKQKIQQKVHISSEKKKQTYYLPQNVSKSKKNQYQGNLAKRIKQQLNRLEMLNKVQSQGYLRQSIKITKSIQKTQKSNKPLIKQNEQTQQNKKKFQRKSSLAPKSKNKFSNQSSYLIQQRTNSISTQKKYGKQKSPTKSNLNTKNNNKLHISPINSIKIQPLSLEKYHSQSFNMSLDGQQIMNNTFSFTPQKEKYQKQQIIPKSHIIRLQKSMEALKRHQKQIQNSRLRRRKIFNQELKQKTQSKNSTRFQSENQRINKIYKKQLQNNNKSIQSKLYNFLVEEDSQSKRPSQKKNKFSPLKRKKQTLKVRSNLRSKIFQSDNKMSSPRHSNASLNSTQFRYRKITQKQRNSICHSIQSFDNSIRGDSIDRNSIERDSVQKHVLKPPQASQNLTKLTEQDIRKQIKKIKQHDFIQRYITNFQLERIMRSYIHQGIPTRKWSLMIIDQVYQSIRAKQQNKQ